MNEYINNNNEDLKENIITKNDEIILIPNVSHKYQEIKKEHYDKLAKIGSFIRKVRKSKKISQIDFSNQMELSRPTLIKLENGYPNIDFYYYLKAMDLLNISMKIELVIKE